MSVVSVTGANGFIASHIVAQLLNKGHIVRAAVRNPEGASASHLLKLPGSENLKLFKASLQDEASYDAAIEGAACVFHTASPIGVENSQDGEKDYIAPAVEGVANVMRSIARTPSVKFVVMTSSMSAVAPHPAPDVKNEEHWSDPDGQRSRGSWYGASKTLAERTATEAIASMPEASRPQFAAICPTMVWGPMLQGGVNATMKNLVNIATGKWPAKVPNDSMSLIDVRDCAAHHIAAFEQRKEGRFMSVAASWHWKDIFAAVQAAYPSMPSPAPLDEGEVPATPTQFDNTRMRSLGFQERSMDVIIAESVEYLRVCGEL